MSRVVSLGLPVEDMQVNAEAIKIGKEAEEANAIASECQAGLDKALPALQAAEDALNVLTKKDMSELKVCLLTQCHPYTGCPTRLTLSVSDTAGCCAPCMLCTVLQGGHTPHPTCCRYLLLWISKFASNEMIAADNMNACRRMPSHLPL